MKAQEYPHLLVTTGLHDSQVQYWEPAKWVAKLRELKTDDRQLLLYTDMDAGHGGKSGRFKAYEDIALGMPSFWRWRSNGIRRAACAARRVSQSDSISACVSCPGSDRRWISASSADSRIFLGDAIDLLPAILAEFELLQQHRLFGDLHHLLRRPARILMMRCSSAAVT